MQLYTNKKHFDSIINNHNFIGYVNVYLLKTIIINNEEHYWFVTSYHPKDITKLSKKHGFVFNIVNHENRHKS